MALNSIREGFSGELPLQSSKWLEISVLLSDAELEGLLDFLEKELGTLFLFCCGFVCQDEEGEISKEHFLSVYIKYLQQLKNGESVDLSFFQKQFSLVMTVSKDHLFILPVQGNRHIIRHAKPIVQLQAHTMNYSSVDKKFHSMTLGINPISWGIQFSYPQLCQEWGSSEVKQIRQSAGFPNTILFQRIREWMRAYTIPTSFLVEDKILTVPIRIGKRCLEWVNVHPQLIEKNIRLIV